MNKRERDLMNIMMNKTFINQRILAEETGHSIGSVNKALKSLSEKGFLNESYHPTEKAIRFAEECRPHRAVILAAGFGMRMIPINLEVPKGLLEVRGEIIIERLIRQLHEVGVYDIDVVVGFMKEQYEYLIDEFGVSLIVNPDYASKNNMYSLRRALYRKDNTYIMPCDVWCEKNPFGRNELYSWYMVSDRLDSESIVRMNRNLELVPVSAKDTGNRMIGISYFLQEDLIDLAETIERLVSDRKNDDLFWENALFSGGKTGVLARVVENAAVIEINTYEQLRSIDSDSDQLKSDAITAIADVFHVSAEEITNIAVLKKGMTNRSFLFTCRNEKYIMRIPGEGTDQLIDRKNETEVYQTIAGKGLCDDVIYINPENGYKITGFLNGIRVCDPFDEDDLKKCMKCLRKFHEMKLQVDHTFDIFDQIDQYEKYWEGRDSIYRDYRKTKENVFRLKKIIESIPGKWCLTHMDAVPDNFLFYNDADGIEQLQLTDWEYAGMQDPYVDIAMFSIYSLYNKEQVDRLIDIYFENQCNHLTRVKIYCYVAACGLLWSNWCEFKRNLGVEFGEYSLRQYRFAKDYYRFVIQELASNDLKNQLMLEDDEP